MIPLRTTALLAALFVGASCTTTQQPPPTEESTLRTRVGTSMLETAQTAEARGDFPSAQAYYRSAYERDHKNVPAAVGLSRTLRRLGRPREAIVIAERALQANAQNPQLLAELGKSQLAANDTLDAIESLSRAGSFLPDSWEIQSALGVGYDRIGMYEQAAHRYEKALLLSPTNAVVLNNYALSLAQTGELDRAVEMLEKATAVPERTAQMRQNLALLYAMSGRFEEAERLVKQDLAPELAAENLAYYRQLSRNSNRGIPKLPAPTLGPGSDSGPPASGKATAARPQVPSAPVTPVARTELATEQKEILASAPAAAGLPATEVPATKPVTPAAPVDAAAKPSPKDATAPAVRETAAPAAAAAKRAEPAPPPATAEPQPAMASQASLPVAAKATAIASLNAAAATEAKSEAAVEAAQPPAARRDAEPPSTETASKAASMPKPAADVGGDRKDDSGAVSASAAPATTPAVATPSQDSQNRKRAAVYDDHAVAARLRAATEVQPIALASPPRGGEQMPTTAEKATPTPSGRTAASTTVAAAPATVPAGAGGPIYRVQLGSYRNQADADHGISMLRSAHQDILASVELDVVQVTLPESGAYFRILTAPFASREAASDVCQELQSREVSCFVRRD